LAELLVDAAQRLVQLGLHRGLPIEALRVPHTPVDERHDAQTLRGPDRLLAALKQVQHEVLDALRPRRLGDGGSPRRREPHRVLLDFRLAARDGRSGRCSRLTVYASLGVRFAKSNGSRPVSNSYSTTPRV